MKEKDWVILILLASLGYVIYRNYNLRKEVKAIKERKNSLLAQLNVKIAPSVKQLPPAPNLLPVEPVPSKSLGNIKKPAI